MNKLIKYNPDIYHQIVKEIDNESIELLNISGEKAMRILFAHDLEKFLKERLKIESEDRGNKTAFRTSFIFCTPEELEGYVHDRIVEYMDMISNMMKVSSQPK